MWKGWKKDKCQSRLFGIGPNGEQNIVDHEEDGIRRSRNRPLAASIEGRKGAGKENEEEYLHRQGDNAQIKFSM
jgi:hypothetical protein